MKKERNANEILNKINLGWNLGNFLDAHDKSFCLEMAKGKPIEEVISLWGNKVFNFAGLDSLKAVKVNCIRIPITWCNFIDIVDNNISISLDAIEYIKQIVNVAIKKGFVVIIDMHHDDQTWLKVACSKKEFRKICGVYKKIWESIAYHFKDYDENLVFEGMNEIIDRSDSDNFDWIGKNKIFFKRISLLYKIFIKAVRKFSLENKQRTLMISTYGAQIHERALKNFVMPKDRNLVVDLHFYSSHTEKEYYEEKFKEVVKYLINKKIPVILGEIGTKKGCVDELRVIKVYKQYADSLGVKCILWDNGKSRKFIDRKTGELVLDISRI